MNYVLALSLLILLLGLTPVSLAAQQDTLSAARTVHIRSTLDGEMQPVRLWVPEAAQDAEAGKPAPLLVCLHSWSTSYKQSDQMAATFEGCRERGWAFLAPNFRGPNRRPEACASERARRDVLDAVAHALTTARVDRKRVYLLGGSGGGHMTLVMAAEAPGLWAAASAWVPITDLAAWHASCSSKGLKYAKDLELVCGGPPGSAATDPEYRRRSPLFFLDRAAGLPIDINVGIRDGHEGSVPIDHSLRAFNALAAANGHPGKTIGADAIAVMTEQAKVPPRLAAERVDEPLRKYKVLFQRQAGPARITVFDGGHHIEAPPALAWLASHARDEAGVVPEPKRSTQAAGANPASDDGALSRSHGSTPAVGRNGMVASSQPLAVQVGVEILQAGGNAVDAAIAVNAMLGLVEPMSCGIGGDLFAIVWDAKTKKLYGLNGSGRSPHGISREVFAERGMRAIPAKGPLAWSVPGCVDGWDELRRRFGSMGFDEILAPAVRYGKQGFKVTPVIARGWRSAERFEDEDARRAYAPNARAPRTGETFRNPRLAATYQAIIDGGRDAFYKGSIAQRIAAASKAKGGLLTMKDLADHRSEWVDPVSTTYRGYRVWELPPNGQGIAVLEMLNVLEGFDLRGLGHNSAAHLHRFIEAKKLAFENRAHFYADMAFVDVPVEGLISKAFGKKQRARIDLERAASSYTPGDPKLVHGDTVYLTVVDKDRNAVSLIQSIFWGWGSHVAPGDVGFMMQNRGCSFSLNEDHANRLEPHKRPFHTIIPAMVTQNGRPWLSFGVMGGDMQPQGHVQVLCNMIDFGMNVQAAGVAPRCRHNGSSTPTGSRMRGGGAVYLEKGIPDDVAKALEAMGHRIATSGTSYGGYQAIRIDWQGGKLVGGSEPRKDGLAMGY